MDLGVSSKEVRIAALDVGLGFEFPQGRKCGVRGLTRLSRVPVSHLGMKLGGREESEIVCWEETARWETRREWFTEAVGREILKEGERDRCCPHCQCPPPTFSPSLSTPVAGSLWARGQLLP